MFVRDVDEKLNGYKVVRSLWTYENELQDLEARLNGDGLATMFTLSEKEKAGILVELSEQLGPWIGAPTRYIEHNLSSNYPLQRKKIHGWPHEVAYLPAAENYYRSKPGDLMLCGCLIFSFQRDMQGLDQELYITGHGNPGGDDCWVGITVYSRQRGEYKKPKTNHGRVLGDPYRVKVDDGPDIREGVPFIDVNGHVREPGDETDSDEDTSDDSDDMNSD